MHTYFGKHLQTTVSVYYQANINLEQSLLVRNLLLTHLIWLCQKQQQQQQKNHYIFWLHPFFNKLSVFLGQHQYAYDFSYLSLKLYLQYA